MADIVLNGHAIDNGVVVKFRTINMFDTVLWSGEVVGVVKYQTAILVSPGLDVYHQQVLKTNVDAQSILDDEFIIINGTDGTSPAKQIAFAVSHILETSVELVEVNANLDLRILNIADTGIANVIQLLTENGYQTRIINNT